MCLLFKTRAGGSVEIYKQNLMCKPSSIHQTLHSISSISNFIAMLKYVSII